MLDAAHSSVVDWVVAWGREVAAADIASGRRRFDDDLIAFGTHADVVAGRDAVEAGQWSQIWPALLDDPSQFASNIGRRLGFVGFASLIPYGLAMAAWAGAYAWLRRAPRITAR